MEILFNVASFGNIAIDNEIFPVMLTFKRVIPEYLKDVASVIEMQRGIIVVNLIPKNCHIQYLYGGSWDDWAEKIQDMLNEFDQDKLIFGQHGDIRLN